MGRDVITLSLGEAFFQLPLFDFEKLDWEEGFHYSDSRGLPQLRKKLATIYQVQYGAKIDYERELLITAGSKIAIYMVLKSLASTGDRVAIFEPGWVSYLEQCAIADLDAYFIPFEDSFKGDLNFKSDTRIVILNNPNNPAGRHYTRAELERIYIACRNVGATLLVDEAYSEFIPEGKFYSARNLGESVVVTNSLSKNLGMSGWRLGYVIGDSRLIDNILILQQNLITCPATILQLYMSLYLDDLVRLTTPQIAEVVKRRQRTRQFLFEHNVASLDGDGTYYLMVNVRELGFQGDVTDFCIYALLKHGVSAVPGISYGESMGDFIRIAVGVEPLERIKEGIFRLIATSNSVPPRDQIIDLQMRMGLNSLGWTQW